MISITTQLTQKDFIKANFVLIFRRRLIKIIFIFVYAGVIGSLLLAAFYGKKQLSIADFFAPVLFLVLMPGAVYLSAKKGFAANARISEKITYQFTEEEAFVKGESFNSQFNWAKLYKVQQTTNWILLWQSSQVANLIPKRDITEAQVAVLKTILLKHGVKNNL